VAEEAREAKPEAAKAEEEVCGLSPNPLPNTCCGDVMGDLLEVSEVGEIGFIESEESLVLIT